MGDACRELPNYLRNVTAPQLPDKIREAFLKAVDNGQVQPGGTAHLPSVKWLIDGHQIRSMPNSKLHPRPFRWPNGVIFVGDCYNMRHPLTGGGMSVAFNDTLIIRNVLRPIKGTTGDSRFRESEGLHALIHAASQICPTRERSLERSRNGTLFAIPPRPR